MRGVLDWETGEKFAEAEITRVREKPLGQVEVVDFKENGEPFESEAAMLAHYRHYYGDHVELDTSVKIINFVLKE